MFHPSLTGIFWFPSVIFLLYPFDYSTLICVWLNEQLNSEALLCRVQSERQEVEQEEDERKAVYAPHLASVRIQPFNSLSSAYKSLTNKCICVNEGVFISADFQVTQNNLRASTHFI